MDFSVDGLITIDQRGTVTSFSRPAARIFGYGADEVIGRNVKMLMPEPYHSAHDGYLAAYLATGVGKIIGIGREVRGRRKDGTIFPMDLAVAEIPNEHGVREFVGSVRDITNRLNIEAQLRQAQKMEAIGNLTGGMAHDFNNLLGIVIGNLDLLAPRLKDDGDSRALLDDALEAGLRGAELTRRLLAFARRQPLQPERIDVNALVGNITKLLARTLGESVEITLDPAPRLWPVIADPAQLEAALANLATNARDAMPRGGKLMIATANRPLDADYAAQHPEVNPGDYVLIEVSDTGSGIAPAAMNRIFEPFFTTKEKGKGTGLGLAMVFGFMKQSGGHINVYSEVGRGTTFRLYLPRDRNGTTSAAAKGAAAAPSRGESVLAVEDNEDLRRVVARQFKELGYRVFEAAAAADALKVLEREKIDLLFSDVVMPGGIDGFELARRAASRWPNLRVLLTSGFPEARLNGESGHPGNIRLLNKPYRKEELAAALRAALDS